MLCIIQQNNDLFSGQINCWSANLTTECNKSSQFSKSHRWQPVSWRRNNYSYIFWW